MKETVTVNGLRFKPYLRREEIAAQVARVASELRRDLEGKRPVFLCVLNGAFMFAADLVREVGINSAPINFVRYSSYAGTSTTGTVKQIIGLSEDVEGQDIVIIEDIVDTGLTAVKMIEDLKKKNPASVRFVTLLHKPLSSKTGFKPDYVAFEIPPAFILGYGLDLDGKGRNLPDIYIIDEEGGSSYENKQETSKADTEMLNLVLFGAPGSGKGTQSSKIIDSFGLHHISTGELLRSHISQGTALGAIADSYISKGQLIPDDLMIDILEHELDTNAKDARGVIFDGFPRTIPQAVALDKLLAKRGTHLSGVIGLEVPEQELIERLINRGKETGRADDNPETIKKRLEVYHSQTEPLKAHYSDSGKYISINGSGIVDDIFNEIAGHIESRTEPRRRK